MTGRLNGKTVIVTAAGQAASALARAQAGAKAIATDLDVEKLEALADVEGVSTQRLDVLDGGAIKAFAAAVSPNALFNCARASCANGAILDCDEDAFSFSVDLNMRAMYRMMRAFLPGMLANGGGSIVNMASVASTLIAAPNRFVYGATKAAVIGMTKSVAADFVAKNAPTPPARPASKARRCRIVRALRTTGAPRASWRASRWAGWARRKKSPISSCSSPATNRP